MSTIDTLIARAIDQQDPRAAVDVVDQLRAQGWGYDRILARVQQLRPLTSEAEWDGLLVESLED